MEQSLEEKNYENYEGFKLPSKVEIHDDFQLAFMVLIGLLIFAAILWSIRQWVALITNDLDAIRKHWKKMLIFAFALVITGGVTAVTGGINLKKDL